MSYVTVIKSIKPETLGKLYKLTDAGVLTKNAVANVWLGKATSVCVDAPEGLAKVLKHACQRGDLALMSGRLSGATTKQVVNLVTEKRLGEMLGCKQGDALGGVQEIDGKKYAARLKRGIEVSSWILVDADNPEGMPTEWRALSLGQRLELLEPIISGISTCLRIEYRSSSARVVKEGEEPRGASHAWIQLSEPQKIEVLREKVKVQMQLHDLSFNSPRYSKDTGGVIGHEARTVIDLAVWVPGRLVFCSKPDLRADGYCLADADVKIVNPEGGKLDVSDIKLPSQADLSKLREATGQELSYSKEATGLSITNSSSLTWETPIEINGQTRSLRGVVANMKSGDKVRCEAPFRASASEAAFIRLMESGMPMLHDVGTSTNYFIAGFMETVVANQSTTETVAWHELDGVTKPSSSAIVKAAITRPPVKELLQRSDQIARDYKSNPIFNHATVMEVIRASSEWEGVLVYNEMSDDCLLMLPVPGTKTPKTTFRPRPLGDDDFVHALSWFNRNGFPRAKKEIIVDCIEAVAKETVLSPIRHYLEKLEGKGTWDHTKRLPRLFQQYFGTVEDAGAPDTDTEYLAAIAVKFMIAAVARMMNPGCKVDTMLVLEGAQGVGKSSAARILAGTAYFSDNLPSLNTKDASDHIRGKWIIELGELSAMQKSEIESTKAFISRQEEKFRPAYRRKEIVYKRRCVFIGTTNQDKYLRDETGNRRFWPVSVGKINLEALTRDRDLLWAEAVHRYRAGEKWHLTAAQRQLATKVQRDRVDVDVWQSELAIALEGVSEVAIRDAACRLGLTIENLKVPDQNRIKTALKSLGFVNSGRFTKGDYRHSLRYVRQGG